MSTLSVKTVLYRAIVALLQASPAVYDPNGKAKNLVRPGNLIRYDQGKPNPNLKPRAEGEYPQLVLYYGRRWQFKGDSSTARYGDHLGGKPAGRTKSLALSLALTLTHGTQDCKADDALEIAVIDALESAGPTLGIARDVLPFVQLQDLSAETVDVTTGIVTPNMSGTQRAETNFTLPVLLRWRQDPSPTQTVTP